MLEVCETRYIPIVSDFDIACFTETHLDHHISNNDIIVPKGKMRPQWGGGCQISHRIYRVNI